MSTHAHAIVFDAPQTLAVRSLELKPFDDADLEVAVLHSGISTGTERLLWDGTMPPFPGLGYPLVPGYETVGQVVRAGPAAAATGTAPTVWETQPARRSGATGYAVVAPADDARKDYAAIYDVSGDASLLNGLIGRLAPGGEVVLAGFYKTDLGFAFAPAFMREASIRIAAQWKKHDLLAVTALVERGALSLDGLITHTLNPGRAREAYEVAFGDPQCLKMMLDWTA